MLELVIVVALMFGLFAVVFDVFWHDTANAVWSWTGKKLLPVWGAFANGVGAIVLGGLMLLLLWPYLTVIHDIFN